MDSVLLYNFQQLKIEASDSIPTPPNGLDTLYEGDSSREFNFNNNRNNDFTSEMDSEDEISIPPSDIESSISDQNMRLFTRELESDSYYHRSVTSFQKVFYFNGADSYAIPHSGNDVQPEFLNVIELWFKEQLFHKRQGSMPILEESPFIAAQGIISKLREESRVFNGLSKVMINIRAGHVYLLHMIGDEIVMPPNYEALTQMFPLFVNVSIKVQPHSIYTRNVQNNACKVLVAVERMTMNIHGDVPSPYGYSCQQLIDGTIVRRVASSADGQLFCILEEIESEKNIMNGANYFFGGASVNMN